MSTDEGNVEFEVATGRSETTDSPVSRGGPTSPQTVSPADPPQVPTGIPLSHDAVKGHRGTATRRSLLASGWDNLSPCRDGSTTEVVLTNVTDHQRRL